MYVKCLKHVPGWLCGHYQSITLCEGHIYKTNDDWDSIYATGGFVSFVHIFKEINKIEYLIELGKGTPVHVLKP